MGKKKEESNIVKISDLISYLVLNVEVALCTYQNACHTSMSITSCCVQSCVPVLQTKQAFIQMNHKI